MLESFPPEIQIIVFYSPIILTLLVISYFINVCLNKGWHAIQASSYAWVGTSVAMAFLFYSRSSNEGFASWVYLVIVPLIFIANYLSYLNLKNIKKRK